MPEYMLLIVNPTEGGPAPEELAAETPLWMRYTQELVDAGVLRGGAALEGAETATTVRVRDGETLVTDGPFAETKEGLAGYYVIDVPDLDAALKWAARIPSVGRGAVEVRPVRVTGAEAPAATASAGAQA